MQSLTKKKTKITLLTVGVVLLTALLVLSGVGIYFKITHKDEGPATVVNPLDFSIDTWDGTVSAADFNENYAGRGSETKTINSASSFVHFINEVNNGNSFEGKKIYLNNSIDLNGQEIPAIGTATNPFKGTFDGGHYTIYNAKINGTGLFGNTENAIIKNIGLYNCEVKTSSVESVGGLIGKAVNTNIENTFVRLGNGNLVNEYISNNGTHYIKNSFVDSSAVGLINKLNTNNSSENEVEISNCYFTNGSSAIFEEVGTVYTTEEKVIKAENKSNFNNWNYSSEYSATADWCDYDYLAGSQELDFIYPLQAGFVKVYLTGSCYESVVVAGDKIVDATNLAQAFDEADKETEAEVNLLVEKIFMEARAEVENSTVTVNAVEDTTIIRGEHNDDAMFVSTSNGKIVIGNDQQTRTGETKKIVLDGNKDFVEENEKVSGALVVAYGGAVDIHENVELKNNVNNDVKNGGAVLLYNTSEQATVKASIENCYAEENGGGICAVGVGPKVIGGISNCHAINGGGGAMALLDEFDQETSALKAMHSLYGGSKNIRPMRTGVYTSTAVEAKTYSGNSGAGGGCFFVRNYTSSDAGALTWPSSLVTFSSNYATGTTSMSEYGVPTSVGGVGGAIAYYYTRSDSSAKTFTIKNAQFSSNYSTNGYGGAIGIVSPNNYRHTYNFAGDMAFQYNYAYGGGTIACLRGSATALGATLNFANVTGGYIRYGGKNSSGTVKTTYGGGIYTYGSVRLTYSGGDGTYAIHSSAATAAGGGIFFVNDANSTEQNVLVSGDIYYCDAPNGAGVACYSSYNSNTTQASYKGLYVQSKIHANDASSQGGAIYSAVPLDVEYSTIYSNTAGYGGAIVVNVASTIANTSFTSNECTGIGGAIYQLASLTVKDCTFTTNKSTTASSSYGGGAIGGGYTLTLSGSTSFDGNSGYAGGAIRTTGTITTSSFTGNFTNNTATGYGGAIYCPSANSVTMTLTGNGSNGFSGNTAAYGGAIIVTSNVTLNITSLTFSSNTTSGDGYGGAVRAEGAVDVNACSFSNNKSSKSGAGALLAKGNLSLTGACSFTGNVAGQQAGAIQCDQSITIKSGFSGSFKSNTASTNGGAIALWGKLTIEAGATVTFESNTATSGYGGAIFSDYNSEVTNSAKISIGSGTITFKSNKAGNTGGAIHTDFAGAEISNVTFESNEATYGGALYTSYDTNATLTLTSCTFKSNKATAGYGGAVAYQGTQTLTINGTYTGNSATSASDTEGQGCGGAVYVSSATTVNITGGRYTGNTSTNSANSERSYGGTICVANESATLTVTGGTFGTATVSGSTVTKAGNSAYRGGALYCYKTVITGSSLKAISFAGNSASRGGAVYSQDLSITGNVKFDYNSADYGGGLNSTKLALTYSNGYCPTFTNNSATTGGGGAYAGIIDFSGSGAATFTSNSAPQGGAIQYTLDRASHTGTTGAVHEIYGTYESNSAVGATNSTGIGCGGAIYVTTGGAKVVDATFYLNYCSNTADQWDAKGGAIHMASGTLEIAGGTFGEGTWDGKSNKGNYSSGYYGGTIFGSTINITGNPTFAANQCKTGWGGAIKATTVNISGAPTFTSNYARMAGGAIDASTVNFTNSSTILFESNNSGYGGGALSVSSLLTLTHNLSFVSNTTNKSGGAIDFEGSSALTIRGSYTNNGASNSSTSSGYILGGAIYVNRASATVEGAYFSGNYSNYTGSTAGVYGWGGAIYMAGTSSTLTLNGGSFENNSTTGNGGAIWSANLVLSSNSTTYGCPTFTGNTADNDGGAIYTNTYQISSDGSSSFNSNSATNNGGAIYTILYNSYGSPTFSGNHASCGGAVYISSGSTSTIYKGNYTDNYAEYQGGAIYLNGTLDVTAIDNTSGYFSGNYVSGTTTASDGYTIYVGSTGVLNVNNYIDIDSTSTDSTKALIYNAGTVNIGCSGIDFSSSGINAFGLAADTADTHYFITFSATQASGYYSNYTVYKTDIGHNDYIFYDTTTEHANTSLSVVNITNMPEGAYLGIGDTYSYYGIVILRTVLDIAISDITTDYSASEQYATFTVTDPSTSSAYYYGSATVTPSDTSLVTISSCAYQSAGTWKITYQTLKAGSCTLTLDFTPGDTMTYAEKSVTVNLTVNPIATTLTVSNTDSYLYVDYQSVIDFTYSASASGTFTVSASNTNISLCKSSSVGSFASSYSHTASASSSNTGYVQGDARGSAEITISFVPSNSGYATATATIYVMVEQKELPLPTAAESVVYDGNGHTFYPGNWDEIKDYVSIENNTAWYSGGYTGTVSLSDTLNYKWTGYEQDNPLAYFSFSITKATVELPTASADLTYNGTEQTWYPGNWSTLTDYATISGNTMTNVGTGTATLTLNNSDNYVWADGSTSSVTIQFIMNPLEVLVPTASTEIYTYNGSEQEYFPANYIEMSGWVTLTNNTRTNAGSQVVVAALNDKTNYVWADGTTDDKTFTFTINSASVEMPTASTQTFTYNGTEQKYYPSNWANIINYATLSNNAQTNVGLYTVTVSLKDNYVWVDGTTADITFAFAISGKSVALPTASTQTFTYDGNEKTYYPSNWSSISSCVTISFNKRTEAGSQTVTVALKSNYVWADGSTSDKTFTFSIAKATVEMPTTSAALTYNGTEQSWYPGNWETLCGYATISGNTSTNAGTKTATLTLTDSTNYVWADGSTPSTTISFEIEPIKVMLPTASTQSFVYDGTEKTYWPDNYADMSGCTTVSNNTRTDVGSQTVTVSLDDKTNYVWEDGTTTDKTFTFTIGSGKLDTPTGLVWITGLGGVSWNAVSTSSVTVTYQVKLYKDGTLVKSISSAATNTTLIDYIMQNGAGLYTFSVVAVSSDETQISNSEESEKSDSLVARNLVITLSAGIESVSLVSDEAARTIETITSSEKTKTIAVPAKDTYVAQATIMEDYEFEKWETNAESYRVSETYIYVEIANDTTSTSDITLNAKAKQTKFDVTISASNSAYGSVSQSLVKVDADSAITVNGSTITIGGTTITATPAAESDYYTYSFDGWVGTTATVVKNMNIVAEFSQIAKTFEITVQLNNSANGTLSSTEKINAPYGTQIQVVDNVLTIGSSHVAVIVNENTAEFTYTFQGWDNAEGTVTGKRTITAKIERTTNAYNVEFVTDTSKGTIEKTASTVDIAYGTKISVKDNVITIGEGSSAITITATPVSGYKFVEWIGVAGQVEGEISITAVYARVS